MLWGWNTVRRMSRYLRFWSVNVHILLKSHPSYEAHLIKRQSIKSISQVMFPSYRGYMASVELGSEDIRKVRKKWFLSKRLLCGIDIYRYCCIDTSMWYLCKGAKSLRKAKRSCRQGRTGKSTPFSNVEVIFF